MDLRVEILKEHSKAQATKIANWIGSDHKRFAQLIEFFLEDEYRVVQRAAWVVSIVADEYPKLLVHHFPDIITKMKSKGLPTAVKRNVLRILQNTTIPKNLHGSVMNSCFQFLADVKETIAVRCFSMSVLANLAKDYPEIKGELKTVIEEALKQKASAGIRARARKVLFELERPFVNAKKLLH